jgi:hypothetical protein
MFMSLTGRERANLRFHFTSAAFNNNNAMGAVLAPSQIIVMIMI